MEKVYGKGNGMKSGIFCGDSKKILSGVDSNIIDEVVTDPPYGLSLMGRKWDVQVPGAGIWREVKRVLKPGAFAFVMSSPRQDVLFEMMSALRRAGFNLCFTSLTWVYASGFPKASSVGKQIYKKLRAVTDHELADYNEKTGENVELPMVRVRKVTGSRPSAGGIYGFLTDGKSKAIDPTVFLTAPASEWVEYFADAFTGYSPRPAVEVIIVAQKPFEEKSAVMQALKNRHGITWLDRCRIPHVTMTKSKAITTDPRGRFTANILVEDRALLGPSSFFSLDLWFDAALKKLPEDVQKTFPNFFVPKPSQSEREGLSHITQKPIKLMSYLIALGSERGDWVLDPFSGSGTTCAAAKAMSREYIGIDLDKTNVKESTDRLAKIKKG